MPTHKGLQVLDIRPNFEAIRDGRLDDFVIDSNAGGRGVPWKATSENRRTISLPFIFENKGEAKEFRKFVADRFSRLEGFWLPMYVNDFRLTQDQSATDTTITVEDAGYKTKHDTAKNQYRHIAVLTRSKLETYGVTAVSVGSGTETLTLNTGLLTDLIASETVVTQLLFVRLADDRLDYEYSNHNLCQVTAKFTELPAETVAADAGTGPHAIVHTGAKPINLYVLTQGGTTYRYTNWPVDVTISAVTYSAADIDHDPIKMGMEFIIEGIKLIVGTDDSAHPLRNYSDRLFLQQSTIEILETDADSPALPSAPIYKGKIGRVPFKEQGRIEAEILSPFQIANYNFPNLPVTRTSPFGVFSANGGLSEATWETAGTITAIDSSQSAPFIEATEISTKQTAESDTDWFSFGKVKVGDETRVCVGSTSGRLYLNAPFRNAAVNDAFTALPGDTKRIGVWNDKFNNLDRFLGFHLLPSSEPQFSPLETSNDTGGKK